MTADALLALSADDGVVEQLALFTDYGAFRRSEGDWVPIPADVPEDEEDPIDGLNATDAEPLFVMLFDSAELTGATLTAHDATRKRAS